MKGYIGYLVAPRVGGNHMTHAVWKQRRLRLFIVSLFTICLLAGFMQPESTFAATTSQHANTKGISWPENQELPTFAQPNHLDVIDLEHETGEMSMLLATLQGIVNRERPRIYLIEHMVDDGKYTWLQETGVPYKMYQDPWQLINKYKKELKGIIIYDPNVPDTINAATTLAGLRTGIVAHPDLVAKLTTPPLKLPILEDLRGRFTGKLDVINWQMTNLWPQTTHRMLIGLDPMTGIMVPEDNWKDFQVIAEETREIMDSSNRKVYDLDVSKFLGNEAVYLRFEDAFQIGGWGAAVHQVTVKADGKVIAQFIPCTDAEEQYVFDHGRSACKYDPKNQHRFADGKRYFVYRFAPPAGTKQLIVSVDMWNQYKVSASSVRPRVTSDTRVPYGYLRDYAVANKAMVFWLSSKLSDEAQLLDEIASKVEPETPYLGWFDSEADGVRIMSNHSVYVIAADWFSNLTVHSGIQRPIQAPKVPATPPLENKIYVTFVMSEGDNFQYNEHHMRMLWNDPNRGKVPITWSTSPLLMEGSPLILNYYQRTATPNDVLVTGPSGMGYFYPSQWPREELATYFEHSKQYLKKTGLDTVYALDVQQDISPFVAQTYNQSMGIQGLFFNASSQGKTSVIEGLPVSIQIRDTTREKILERIKQNAANWDGKSPLFLSVQLVAWDSTPSDVVYFTQQLGSNFVTVRGDHFFQLFRQANGLPPTR
ncbi:GxGYxY motif-containing protein [Thermosporothrix hazakensis]|uniref:GxGYxY motif-containing protein n=2 Tax=Thermosporothrix hazakensis TaxID=644383 RepID=A0A326U6E3_THEHA|nr:GxGYxY motif-containing protein [Thermosporothrix hazakensis]